MLFLCILFFSSFLLTKHFGLANVPVVFNETLLKQPNSGENNNLNVSQIVERSLVSKNNSSKLLNETKPIRFGDFKPSPQFSSGYGYDENEKSRTASFPNNNNWMVNNWQENPNRQEDVFEKSPKNQIKFPVTVERPYTFENHNDYFPPPTNSIDFTHNQTPYKQPSIRPQENIWKKIFGFTGFENKQKSFHETYTEQPYFNNYYEHEHEHEHGHEPPREFHHDVGHYGGGISPFKKILKVLATIIPIGLFISALTPTIITVSTVNDTKNRNNRKFDVEEIAKKLTPSLNSLAKLQQEGCEQKVFCELMVNSMFSKNAEDHIKNLLHNFVSRKGIDDGTISIKILEAVKKHDCSPLICNIKEDPI